MPVMIRATLSVVAVIVFVMTDLVLEPMKGLMSAELAGKQLESSDTGYLANAYGQSVIAHLGIPFLALLIVLALLWWKPMAKWLMMGALVASMLPASAWAYYQKSDYADPIMIEPSESAFWVPSTGDNEHTQVAMDTEDYYRNKKISKKLFLIPHMHLTGSGTFFDYYVPSGTLIIVDRSMYSREWIAALHRGTSARDEGIHCQSSEGIDTTVGVSIGTEVTEDQAPRFLSHFKTKTPQGSRTDPQVMFNAVYFSPSLAEVMDNVLRPVIGQMVCKQIMARTVDDASREANVMMDAIRVEVTKYLDNVGIKLDNIGWADTFTYPAAVQAAIDQRYAVEKLRPILDVLREKAMIDAVQKTGWNGALPSSISVSFWPDSWTQAIRGFLHLGTSAPPAPASTTH